MILRFQLVRKVDPTGVSGTGLVAEGCRFTDGTVVIRWLGKHKTSTFHESMESVRAVHSHENQTLVVWNEADFNDRSSDFMRGVMDASQDACENVPFASVGGLQQRAYYLSAPKYEGNPIKNVDEYLAGYKDAAWAMYGADWRTCEFSWKPALTIE